MKRTPPRFWACAFIALVTLLGATNRARAEQIRRALVVGNNIGNDPAHALRYAEEEVGRLGDVLRRAGQFQQVDILRGVGKAEVERALDVARQRMAADRAAGRTTLFIFYYSGHGDAEALELGSTRLPLRDLRLALEQSPADVRLAFVDACQSGALTGWKGGRRAPGYEVRMVDPGNVQGLAIVTSSTESELSQESEDLRGSYFSHNLMVGLQGLADRSADGQVTLSELYEFAFQRTLASTALSPMGGQHPSYVYRMSGTGDVVLSRTRPSDARLRFPPDAGATYTVLRGGDVIAELVAMPTSEVYLAVPAGRYRVVRRVLTHLTAGELELAAGNGRLVEPAEFEPVAVPAALALRKKEGTGAHASANLVAVQAGMATSVVPGSAGVVGTVGASFRHTFGGFALRARADFSSFSADSTDGFRSSLLRIGPSLDGLFSLVSGGPISFELGPTVGVPWLRQRAEATTAQTTGSTFDSWGVQYGGVATFTWSMTRSTAVVANFGAGGESFRLDGKLTQRPYAGLTLGAGFAF